MQRHTVVRMVDVSPYVQMLDAPVPQMVDNVMASFRLLDKPIADQVIEVPKISCPFSCPSRAFLFVPQVVEQFVEVPPVLTPALLQQQVAEADRRQIQFRVVVVVVFKVFFQNRTQLRSLSCRTLKFQFFVKVFKVYAQDRVQRRFSEVQDLVEVFTAFSQHKVQ